MNLQFFNQRLTLIVEAIALVGIFPFIAYSQIHPPTVANQIARVLNSAASPWTSVPNSSLRFLVVEENGKSATAIGFSSEELLYFTKTPVLSGKSFMLANLDLPAVDFFTECNAKQCGENQNWNEVQRRKTKPIADLSKSVGQPILMTSTRLPTEWSEGLSRVSSLNSDLLFTLIVFHEAFHMHQERINKPRALTPSRSKCLEETEFSTLFPTDLDHWRSVIEASGDMKREKIRTALDFRKRHPHVCFESGDYRSEGIANYFAYAFLLEAAIVPKQTLDELFSTFWLTVIPREKILSYYDYGIGTAMGVALQFVSSDSSWQESIESGVSLEDALRVLTSMPK